MESEIKDAITEALKELDIATVDFVVEHPTDFFHGDYATNVALILSKQLGKNPLEIAEQLLESLEGKISFVEKITIAGPGFVNFYLSRNFFSEKIATIVDKKDSWGNNDSWAGKKVIVEYTDPNPFKEFHVGHLFTNTVGESIARLFMMNGADTKRVNYQGDIGLHVAHALYGMQELGITVDGEITPADLGRAYAYGARVYKENEEVQETIKEINKKLYERSDDALNELYDRGRDISLTYFESMYKILDTEFDNYFFESDAAPKGKELVESNPDIFVESEGAKIFEGEKYGLHTRVFLNKEGLPTYEAKELALAKMKEEHFGTYDLAVVSTSNEISEYFKVLIKAMSFVYPDLSEKTEHIGHGTVKLMTGKMSSRTGDVIRAVDFIDEVADATAAKMDEGGKVAPNDDLAKDIAVGAIKYAALKGNILQDSIYDNERALSFEGDSGPYLQYTHARISSVLEKAKDAGITMSLDTGTEEAYEVEKYLYQFEEVTETALKERAPHKVVTYLTELAGAFNTFYAHEKIADISDEDSPYKVAVAEAVKITLKNGLWVLGIKAPERM